MRALAIIEHACRENKPTSVGVLGNAAEVYLPELGGAAVKPDHRSPIRPPRHDPINGYLPKGWNLTEGGEERRRAIPRAVEKAAERSIGRSPCPGHAGHFWRMGIPNRRLRQQHPPEWRKRRRPPMPSTSPGFVPAYIRARCSAVASVRFRWAALSVTRRTSSAPDAKVGGSLLAG